MPAKVLPVTNGLPSAEMPVFFSPVGRIMRDFGPIWERSKVSECHGKSVALSVCEASAINNVKTGAPNCRRVILWWASRKGHYS